MKTKTIYKLEDVIADNPTATHIEIIKKIDDFLSSKKRFHALYCGPKIYKYIQMSSKFKAESNENNLEFPILFGTWVNGDQRLALYLSPNKCKEDEFILDEERYTREEVHEMFENDKTLDDEFRREILGRLDATYQAMWNCVNDRDNTMEMANTYGDRWLEEYNRFVQLYQKYETRRTRD
jgi:hypothetical protein